jgi:uncharacterized protein
MSQTGPRPIDCDVHCAPQSIEALYPYLSAYWKEYIEGAGAGISGLAVAYPPGAPTSARPDARENGGPAVPAGYEGLKERVLDPSSATGAPPRYAVLNCLTAFEVHRNPHYSAAVAAAVNDWLCAEWLDRDERLRAGLAVSPHDPDAAVEEIERLAGDPRFVQVLLPVRTDAPYGNKRYHRLLEAAVAHDLAIGIHAWGRTGKSITSTGFTSTYLEDYLGNTMIVQNHLLSLVSEGVFERFPALRVCLIECGFAWLPPFLWRFDKDWKGVWREVPWVKEKPSTYVKRHFRATTAPAHLPEDPRQVDELLAMVGTDWLLHASDYPHDHGPSTATLYDVLDKDAKDAVLLRNAAAFYKLGV